MQASRKMTYLEFQSEGTVWQKQRENIVTTKQPSNKVSFRRLNLNKYGYFKMSIFNEAILVINEISCLLSAILPLLRM